MAEAWILSNGGSSKGTLQASPISPDKLVLCNFFSPSSLSKLPSFLSPIQTSTIPPCASDYTFLPSPWKPTGLPDITESSHFMELCIPPPKKLHLPFWPLSLGTCVPFSWCIGWNFQWLQSKVTEETSKHQIHQWLCFQFAEKYTHCVRNSLLLTHKKWNTKSIFVQTDSLPNVTRKIKELPRHFLHPSLDTQACATCSETSRNNVDDNGYSGCIDVLASWVVCAGRKKATSSLKAQQESSQRYCRL